MPTHVVPHEKTLQDARRQTWLRTDAGLLAACTCMALFWLCACVFLIGMRYEVNDDACLSNIAAGAFGEESQYLIYSNILFGYLCKALLWIWPGANWYVLLSLALCCVAMGAIGWVLCSRLGKRAGMVLYALCLLLVGSDLFCSFQYTKNSALLLVAGAVVIAQTFPEKRALFWLGAALFFAGSLVRFECFIPAVAIACPLFAYRIWKLEARRRVRAVISVLLLFGCCMGARGADRLSYENNPQWAGFLPFNEARMELSDYKFPFLEDRTEFYNLGFDDADYALLAQWNFYDTEHFSAERLAALNDTIVMPPWTAQMRHYLVRLPQRLFLSGPGLFFLLGVGCFLLGTTKRKLLFGLATMGIVLGGLFLLQYQGRTVYRVEAALLLIGGCCLLAFCAPIVGMRKRAVAAGAVLCALQAVAAVWLLVDRYEANAYYLQTRLEAPAVTDAMTQDQEHLYLLDTAAFDAAMGYDVFRPRTQGYFSNIVFMGSWLCESGFARETLERYGMENPLRDLPDSDAVLYLIQPPLAVSDYLKKYDAAIQLEADTCGGVAVYRAVR